MKKLIWILFAFGAGYLTRLCVHNIGTEVHDDLLSYLHFASESDAEECRAFIKNKIVNDGECSLRELGEYRNFYPKYIIYEELKWKIEDVEKIDDAKIIKFEDTDLKWHTSKKCWYGYFLSLPSPRTDDYDRELCNDIKGENNA